MHAYRVQGTPRSVGVIKPDIVFFYEDLPPDFYQTLKEDRDVSIHSRVCILGRTEIYTCTHTHTNVQACVCMYQCMYVFAEAT